MYISTTMKDRLIPPVSGLGVCCLVGAGGKVVRIPDEFVSQCHMYRTAIYHNASFVQEPRI